MPVKYGFVPLQALPGHPAGSDEIEHWIENRSDQMAEPMTDDELGD
jgi:hypothetical protein